MMSLNPQDWTATQLRDLAKEHGIKSSQPKDELWQALLPIIEAKRVEAKEKQRLAAEHAAQEEARRKQACAEDFKTHSEYYKLVNGYIVEHIKSCERTITEFIEYATKYGPTGAISHYGDRACSAEKQMKCWLLVNRFFQSVDHDLQDKLNFFEERLEHITDSFVEYGSTEDRHTAQVYSKAIRSIKAYIKTGKTIV